MIWRNRQQRTGDRGSISSFATARTTSVAPDSPPERSSRRCRLLRADRIASGGRPKRTTRRSEMVPDLTRVLVRSELRRLYVLARAQRSIRSTGRAELIGALVQGRHRHRPQAQLNSSRSLEPFSADSSGICARRPAAPAPGQRYRVACRVRSSFTRLIPPPLSEQDRRKTARRRNARVRPFSPATARAQHLRGTRTAPSDGDSNSAAAGRLSLSLKVQRRVHRLHQRRHSQSP